MRSGQDNLIPFNKLTESEQREIASRGGKASGKSRKRKADLKKVFNTLLSLDIQDERIKKQIEEMGMEGDNQALLAFSVFQQAIKGNQKAVKNLISLVSNKDDLDIKEQKEKIKSLKINNEKNEKINKKLDDKSMRIIISGADELED